MAVERRDLAVALEACRRAPQPPVVVVLPPDGPLHYPPTPQPLPVLTNEMLARIDHALRGRNEDCLRRKAEVKITVYDLRRLESEVWLNDELIGAYLRLMEERAEELGGLSVYSLSPIFTIRLMSRGYLQSRPRVRQVDFFAYDLILCPFNVLSTHWIIIIVDNRDRTINHYDSQHGFYPECVDAVRDLIQGEHLDTRKTYAPHYTTVRREDVPKQVGPYDCGVFACMYAEFETRGAPITFTQDDMEYFRRKMAFEILSDKLLT